MFSSGNTFEDYLRILQRVPNNGAVAYVRGQWGVQGGGKGLGKGISELSEKLLVSFTLGLVANGLFVQMGIL